MKNILCYIPALLIVIAMTAALAVPVSAVSCPTFIVEASEMTPVQGDEVTITVSVQGTSDLQFGVIQLAYVYDMSKLQLLEQAESSDFVTEGDRLLFTKAFDSQEGDYINYIYATPKSVVFSEKTTLFTMRFKVLTDTAGVIEQSLRHVVTLDVNSETVFSPLDKYSADAEILQTTVSVPKKVGGEIKGQISACNPQTETKIELLQNGLTRYSKTLETQIGSGYYAQEFSMSSFEEGVYDLRIVKAGHLPYTRTGVEIKVDSVIDLAQISLSCGDVNGDGKITQTDITVIRLAENYSRAVGDTGVNALCDLNGDGVCNILDVAIVRRAMDAIAD